MRAINNLIYFNNNRSTVIDPEVEADMQKASEPANPLTLAEAKNDAAQKVAELIGCSASEVFFTSGTTESLQLAIRGLYRNAKNKKHIITSVTEHPAVTDTCRELEAQGAKVTWLKVDKEGLIDLDELKTAFDPHTLFVAIMAANNETGVIQNLDAIAELCRQNSVPFLSDGSQYVSKIRCDVDDTGIDLLAFGAHKMYGPKDIGVLYIRKEIQPYFKDLQKKEFPLALLKGMGKCAEIARRDLWDINTHVSKLKNHFEHQLLEIPALRINGSTRHRLYNTSNLTFPPEKDLAPLFNRFDFAHNKNSRSHVLKAMGLSDADISHSYRFSFGKYNNKQEVDEILQQIFAL